MRRRDFLVLSGVMVLVPLAHAVAQKGPHRIAVLFGTGASTETSNAFFEYLRAGLKDHGLTEGRDYYFDTVWAEGDYGRFPELAAALVQRRPSMILVSTIAAARAAQRATTSIPIVMTGLNDPVGTGLVQSLARPGGNTTGTSNVAEDTVPKLLQFLLEIVTGVTAIGVLLNPDNPSNLVMQDEIRKLAAGRGLKVSPVEVNNPAKLDAAFREMAQRSVGALIVLPDNMLFGLNDSIGRLALQDRLPTFSFYQNATDAGGLLSYGALRSSYIRRTASYVKRILDRGNPADMPVELPTEFQLSINLRTARALGVAIPESLRVRADKVIE